MQSPLSNNRVSKYLQVKDYLVSNKNFDLFLDKEWDMLLTLPIPENLEQYYQSQNYQPHKTEQNSWWDRIYKFIRNQNFRYKYKLLKKYHPEAKSVLDYGAATGEFLAYLSQKNLSVCGIEPNEKAKEIAQKNYKINIHSDIDTITEKFDIITLWHVLEHLPDLETDLNKILQRLNKNGILMIAVPNFKSHDAQHYKEHWAAYDVPRHLWHFSPLAIEKLVTKLNCRLIAKKPLLFDSFYVSLLSEEYKTGKKNIIPAVYTGLISNLKATKNRQYSSLIYIIQKV